VNLFEWVNYIAVMRRVVDSTL